MTSSTPRLRAPFAVAAASALVLSACSGDISEESSETAGGDTAAFGSCDVAPDYPNGPVEIVVPWSAGGGTDSVARLLGNSLSDSLGVQVNVVNRTGGAGVVGHQAMASANPDGQTLGLVTSEISMMHWQGLTDLTPDDVVAIAQVNADPAAVSVGADSEYANIQELLDAIEANPGTVTASGTAQGGLGHVAMLGMLMAADLPVDAVTWVPSEGAAPAVQELVAGGVDFIVTSSAGEVAPMVEAGELSSIAVMADEPDQNFPDIPLLKDEADNDYTGGTWRGVSAPVGTDENIVEEVGCHVEEIVETEEFEEFLSDSGFSAVYADGPTFATFMDEQDAMFGEVMEAGGLTE
ncbi:tripartite tricarboxylate transporter substrate binding protein [Isoptericola halotolerans]|uniref:tripartite tricarboxylate transporter substrate binding protein n=1 Tax=Isoptericola halotolerans TaxID=300560 RepID=UPI00388D112E